MDRARRQGKGLIVTDWRAAETASGPDREFIESIIDWCKDALAGCRRPYGVDQFDLVLSFRANDRTSSLRFNKLRPLQLYDEGFSEEVRKVLLRKFSQADALIVDVKAGVFSWGNALHAALATEQPRSN